MPSPGVFAEEIALGTEEAGKKIGPLFERIRSMLEVDQDTMFDFSDQVLIFSPSHEHGQAAHATLKHKAVFARGARTALRAMKREPTLFVTVSRNFHSWFLAECPSPDSFADRS